MHGSLHGDAGARKALLVPSPGLGFVPYSVSVLKNVDLRVKSKPTSTIRIMFTFHVNGVLAEIGN